MYSDFVELAGQLWVRRASEGDVKGQGGGEREEGGEVVYIL